MPNASPRYCTLEDTGFVEVAGNDARDFLHGQLSLDIRSLALDRAPLAGWHDAKGRLRALVRIVPRQQSWLLMAPGEIAEEIAGKLRMFVLRSDVTLAPGDDIAALAVIGNADDWLARSGIPLGTETNAAMEIDGVHWLRIGPALMYMVGRAGALARLVAGLEPAPPGLAELAEIELGIASITTPLSGRFVPQMLNLERLGAISFDKGCYPGQEVIARIHNLGSVKRRMRRFATGRSAAIEPGSEIHDSDKSVVGEVIRAATAREGSELLAVVELNALTGALYLDDGLLTELPLPYADSDLSK